MLSRVFTKNLLRQSAAMSRMTKPGTHVCFCGGCMEGKLCNKRNTMMNIPQRNFQDHLNLDSTFQVVPVDVKKGEQVALWQDIRDSQQNSLVLKSNDEIEQYVLSLVRNYFRTTKKASVALDIPFADHGLDSLDVIELVIQVEDELGYIIDAEKLELFSKPRHFVNYIAQLEAYRTEHNRLPHEGVYEDFNIKKHFPGLPSLGH